VVIERVSEIVRVSVLEADILFELVRLGVGVREGDRVSLTVTEAVSGPVLDALGVVELSGVSDAVSDSETLAEGVTLPETEESGVFDLLTDPDGENDTVFEIDIETVIVLVSVSDTDGEMLANNDKLAVGEALFELVTDSVPDTDWEVEIERDLVRDRDPVRVSEPECEGVRDSEPECEGVRDCEPV